MSHTVAGRVRFCQKGSTPCGWLAPVRWQPGQGLAVRDRSAFFRGSAGVAEFVRVDERQFYDEHAYGQIVSFPAGSRSCWRDPFGREFPTLAAALAAWPDQPLCA